jgi:hypothetical protein
MLLGSWLLGQDNYEESRMRRGYGRTIVSSGERAEVHEFTSGECGSKYV